VIALAQRVSEARVCVEGSTVSAIGTGLLVFVCAEAGDTEDLADRLVTRLLKLRIFADAQGRMNRSVTDVAGALLLVSQFTLAAELSGGHRPSFSAAAPAPLGRRLFERVVAAARARYPRVECGVFGASMQVHLVNDGPVTIPLTLRPASVARPDTRGS
jgi:D-tyrosyl-tRNA(Tyr) deacylase